MKTGIKILFTTSIITAILALVMLIKGNGAGFFDTLVISLGFVGLGWAGRCLVLPDIRDYFDYHDPPHTDSQAKIRRQQKTVSKESIDVVDTECSL